MRLGLRVGVAAAAALGMVEWGGSAARAQVPGSTVVYETVAPASTNVTYGVRTRIKNRPFRTVIKERPVAYVTRTPAVIRETRLIQPAPVVENVVVQPAPIVEQRVIRSSPIVETRTFVPYP
jgi:hypothetical protein